MGCLWEAYLKVSGWISEYQSVNNLLRYLKYRRIGSEASRNTYGRTINAFCHYTGRLPDELVDMKKTEIEKLLEEFCYYKKESGCSSRTVNVTLLCLRPSSRLTVLKVTASLKLNPFINLRVLELGANTYRS